MAGVPPNVLLAIIKAVPIVSGADRTALVLRYYIEGSGHSWQGICVDLDIAAQGESLAEVQTVLEDMVTAYLQTAMTYSGEERHRLLNRKSPLLVRLKFAANFFSASLFATATCERSLTCVTLHYNPPSR